MKFLFALLLAPIGAFVAGFDVMLTLFGVSTPLGYARSKWLESRNSITREIIICENCYLSGYVGTPCKRCGHVIGNELGLPPNQSEEALFKRVDSALEGKT